MNSPRGGSRPELRSADHNLEALCEFVAQAERPTAPTAATAPMKSRRLNVFSLLMARFLSYVRARQRSCESHGVSLRLLQLRDGKLVNCLTSRQGNFIKP